MASKLGHTPVPSFILLMLPSVLQATPVSLCKASFLRVSWLGFDSQLHKSSIVSSSDKMA